MANPDYTICIDPTFRTSDLATWRRDVPGPSAELLTVRFGARDAPISLSGPWPPGLDARSASERAAGERDSVMVRTDTVNGVPFHTEIGVRRDAQPGTPARWRFISGFRTPDGPPVMAEGASSSADGLDTLLRMFHSVARSPTPDPNPRE